MVFGSSRIYSWRILLFASRAPIFRFREFGAERPTSITACPPEGKSLCRVPIRAAIGRSNGNSRDWRKRSAPDILWQVCEFLLGPADSDPHLLATTLRCCRLRLGRDRYPARGKFKPGPNQSFLAPHSGKRISCSASFAQVRLMKRHLARQPLRVPGTGATKEAALPLPAPRFSACDGTICKNATCLPNSARKTLPGFLTWKPHP